MSSESHVFTHAQIPWECYFQTRKYSDCEPLQKVRKLSVKFLFITGFNYNMEKVPLQTLTAHPSTPHKVCLLLKTIQP